jgi:hypothetical protein
MASLLHPPNTPLQKAAANGNVKQVKSLLSQGTQDEIDQHGFSALVWASFKGHTSVVKHLLSVKQTSSSSSSSTLNPPPLQHTALRGACVRGHLSVAKLLVQAGAAVDIPSKGNRTAAMGAAMHGHTAILKLLILQRCDLAVVNDFGETALDLALDRKHNKCVDLIRVAQQAKPGKQNEQGSNATINYSWTTFVRRLSSPAHPGSLAMFRVLFGLCMFLDTVQERGLLFANQKYQNPSMCTFSCFDLKPVSIMGFHFIMGVLLITSINITVGFMYRLSMIVFSGCFWYLFLLDKRTWNNHTYLFATLSSVFIFLDAHATYSVDSVVYYFYRKMCCNAKAKALNQPLHVPSWQIWIVRVLHFMVYTIAGLKKLMDFDWTGGYAMTGLSSKPLFQVVFKPYLFLPLLYVYRYSTNGVSPYEHAYSSNYSLHSYYKDIAFTNDGSGGSGGGGGSSQGEPHPWFYIELTVEDEALFEECLNHFIHKSGLLLDLFVGWLLMTPRFRTVGIVSCISFHLMTTQMFNIGMFPWVSLCLLTMWWSPSWPTLFCCSGGGCNSNTATTATAAIEETLLNTSCANGGDRKEECFPGFPSTIAVTTSTKKNRPTKKNTKKHTSSTTHSPPTLPSNLPSTWHHCTVLLLSLFILVECFLPYSHFITKGYNAWTQGLYGYSWDMMIHTWRTQHVRVGIKSTDRDEFFIRPDAFLNIKNQRNFKHPDMLKQYAKCVSHGLHDMGVEGEIEIYVDVWRSMNKRYQQRFINPFVDLAKAPWSPYTDTSWVLPCLFDYDDQRDTLDKIADHYSKEQIDVVFVADFPNMTLEHYINGTENINVDLILMHGKIDIIFGNGERYPVPANVNVSLPLDETHTVETMGATPSRFMYAYEGRDVKEENKMAERKLLNLTAFDTIVLDWEEESEKLKNMTKYLKEKSQDIWKATNPVVQFTTFVHKFIPNLMLAMVLSEEGFRHYWDQGFSIAMLDGVVRWFGGDEKQVKQEL